MTTFMTGRLTSARGDVCCRGGGGPGRNVLGDPDLGEAEVSSDQRHDLHLQLHRPVLLSRLLLLLTLLLAQRSHVNDGGGTAADGPHGLVGEHLKRKGKKRSKLI